MFKKLCLLLLCVLALGACSKSAPTADAGPTDDTTTQPTDDTNGGDGNVEEFCATGEATLGSGNPFEGFDPSSPDALRTGFTQAVNLFEELLAVAPADVAVTIQDGVAAMVAIKTRLDAVNYDFTKLTPEDSQAFSQLATKFDFQAFATAAAQYCAG